MHEQGSTQSPMLCVRLPRLCRIIIHDTSVSSKIESYFGQPKGQRMLVVGCGHSAILSELHAMGYRCITATDISATVIAWMQAENEDKEGIECEGVIHRVEIYLCCDLVFARFDHKRILPFVALSRRRLSVITDAIL